MKRIILIGTANIISKAFDKDAFYKKSETPLAVSEYLKLFNSDLFKDACCKRIPVNSFYKELKEILSYEKSVRSLEKLFKDCSGTIINDSLNVIQMLNYRDFDVGIYGTIFPHQWRVYRHVLIDYNCRNFLSTALKTNCDDEETIQHVNHELFKKFGRCKIYLFSSESDVVKNADKCGWYSRLVSHQNICYYLNEVL